MRKLAFAVVGLFVALSGVHSEEKSETIIGLSLNLSNLNISGPLGPDGNNLVACTVGATYAYIPLETGFSVSASLSLPIYQILDGVVVSGSGLTSTTFLGYGKSFVYTAPANKTFRNMVHLAAGVHLNIHSLFAQNFVMSVYSLGPATTFYVGQAADRFRIGFTFWYDPIAWYVTSVDESSSSAKLNIGGMATFGLKL